VDKPKSPEGQRETNFIGVKAKPGVHVYISDEGFVCFKQLEFTPQWPPFVAHLDGTGECTVLLDPTDLDQLIDALFAIKAKAEEAGYLPED
jgi:hypothetical protein